MKNIKRLTAISLAVIMLLCMSITVFYADDETPATGTRSIVITNPKKDNHTYEAYQVFSGKATEDGGKKTITDIQWGNGVDGEALLAALIANDTVRNDFKNAKSAADVANVLSDYTTADDSVKLDAVADVINANLTDAAKTQVSVEEADDTYQYTIEVDGDGYYFVKDSESVTLENPDAVTKFILEVAGEAAVEVEVKTDFPNIDKNIIEDGKPVKVNTASVGDVVTYQVTSAVPDMKHYKTYFFQVQDTMDEGLSLDTNSFHVTIGGDDIDSSAYELTAPDGDYTFTLRFNEFIQYKGRTGDEIVIEYKAVVNEFAKIGDESNDNTVNLKFSNDPNQSSGSDNEPDSNNPTGQTPDHTVKTYVSKIKVLKLDGATQKPLPGVEFTITGSGVNKVLLTEEVFEAAEDGTYYKLTDGTYTTEAPTDDTAEYYDSTEIKYAKNIKINSMPQAGEDHAVTATVNENGVVEFTGLGAGVYTISENPLKGYQEIGSVTVNIQFDDETETWSALIDGPAELIDKNMTDGVVTLTLENNVSVSLPSTGGSGVMMFYVIGGILIAGALVALLALKKRSSKN